MNQATTKIIIMRLPIILILLTLTTTILSAEFYQPVSGSLSMLNIPSDARSAGMADTFVAVANDINTIFYNLAGLVNIKKLEFSFTQSLWFADLKFTDLSLGFNISKKFGSLGFNLKFLSLGNIKETDRQGELSDVFLNGYVLAFATAYARDVIRNFLSAGLVFKYAKESYETEFINLFGVDISFFGSIIERLNYGINFQNIGYSKPSSGSTKMPFTIRLGLSYTTKKVLIFNKIITAIDLEIPTFVKRYFKVHTGIEIVYTIPPVGIENSIRAGFDFPNKSKSFFDSFTLGLGIALRNWSFDWSLRRMGVSGGFVNKFSFKYKI